MTRPKTSSPESKPQTDAAKSKAREQDHKSSAAETKKVRSHMTEEQIDETLKESFPASDPPGLF